MMIKDIGRFKNRDIKRSMLIDPKPVNFLLTPDSGLPCIEYNAEFVLPNNEKDSYLLSLIEEIKEYV